MVASPMAYLLLRRVGHDLLTQFPARGGPA